MTQWPLHQISKFHPASVFSSFPLWRKWQKNWRIQDTQNRHQQRKDHSIVLEHTPEVTIEGLPWCDTVPTCFSTGLHSHVQHSFVEPVGGEHLRFYWTSRHSCSVLPDSIIRRSGSRWFRPRKPLRHTYNCLFMSEVWNATGWWPLIITPTIDKERGRRGKRRESGCIKYACYLFIIFTNYNGNNSRRGLPPSVFFLTATGSTGYLSMIQELDYAAS